ncbi:TcpQ domain-containing protein [Leptothrix sp. BB-4]
MNKVVLASASLVFLIGGMGPASLHAQQLSPEKEEVLVEWDVSKRMPIHSAPFSRSPWGDEANRAAGPDVLAALRLKDATERSWAVQFSDGTVRRMLARWSSEAGYQLLWDVPRDYPIEVEMNLQGSFRDVVWLVVKSLSETDAPVQASINADIRLIRVVRFLNGQAR